MDDHGTCIITADRYSFNNKERGIALLIHNEFFYRSSGYKDRPGDDIDYKHMKKVFKTLGFKVCSFKNKTKKEILKIAEDVAEMKNHENADCFVCVLASHGVESQTDTGVHSTEHNREHFIVGVDGKELRTQRLIQMFDDDHCEGLKSKPKFFFIQACRISKYKDKLEGMDKGLQMTFTGQNAAEKTKKPKGKHGLDATDFDSGDDREDSNTDNDSSDDSFDEYMTSDTDDDQEFYEFKARFKEEETVEFNESYYEKVEQRKKRQDELDAKGSTPDGQKLDVKGSTPDGQKLDAKGSTPDGQKLDAKGSTPEGQILDVKALVEEKTTTGKEKIQQKINPSKKKLKRLSYIHKDEVPMITLVPCPEDTLLMFASLSGNFAVRGRTTGGWLLDKLYQCLRIYSKNPGELQNIDFLQILTEVLTCMSREMFRPGRDSKSSQLSGHFSPGCFTHCLTKNVYFTKKQSKRKNTLLSCLQPSVD